MKTNGRRLSRAFETESSTDRTNRLAGPLGIGALFALLVFAEAMLNPLIGAPGLLDRLKILVADSGLLAALALFGLAAAKQSWHTALAWHCSGCPTPSCPLSRHHAAMYRSRQASHCRIL